MTHFKYWAVCALIWAGCAPTQTEGVGPTQLDEALADQIVYGVRRNMSKDGIREAILEGDSMFVWEDSSHIQIEGLRLTVFNDLGVRQATIVALRGKLTESSSELTALGDVVLTIPEGNREIRSQELKFAPETDRIWTDSAVVMTEGDCTVEGDRLQADMDFNDVRIWATRGRECTSR